MRDQIANFSKNYETVLDVFKGRSYMQNIKSKSRMSETLVIQQSDFFEVIGTMSAN